MSLKVFTKIEKTFLLRGINPDEIAKKYNDGYFKNCIKKAINNSFLDSNIDCDNTKPIYYDSKSFNKCLIVTSNYEMFNNYKDGEGLPIKGKCQWCLLQIIRPPIGIPIKCIKNKDKYIFYVDGVYCSFPCCFSGLKRLLFYTFKNDKPLYKNSEQLLRLMYDLNYPGKKLFEAPDWQLLVENGGSLTKENFFDSNYSYCKIPGYLIPIKTRYITKRNV